MCVGTDISDCEIFKMRRVYLKLAVSRLFGKIKYDRSHCRSVFEARLVVSTYCFLGTELLSFDFNYTIYSYILRERRISLSQMEAHSRPAFGRTKHELSHDEAGLDALSNTRYYYSLLGFLHKRRGGGGGSKSSGGSSFGSSSPSRGSSGSKSSGKLGS